MTQFTDLTVFPNSAYKLADLIEGGHYHNIFYYEFHEEVDPINYYNCLEGLESFQERANDFYKIFISSGLVDDFPAVIHIALQIGNEWFISQECGSNFYLGYGPTGILKLREACAKKNITAFGLNENLDSWLKNKFGKSKRSSEYNNRNNDVAQFNKICNFLQQLTNDMQRRPSEFQDLSEDNIRDRMLVYLNGLYKGRGHAESKNRNGKTDLMIKTKDGLNEHIFELKIWKGINTLKDAIKQLSGYISWHNNYCGIIIFNFNKQLTSILNVTEIFLEDNYNFSKRDIQNEFRFRMVHQTDEKKNITVHLIFINLCNNVK
jgi:hypothetical protein